MVIFISLPFPLVKICVFLLLAPHLKYIDVNLEGTKHHEYPKFVLYRLQCIHINCLDQHLLEVLNLYICSGYGSTTIPFSYNLAAGH